MKKFVLVIFGSPHKSGFTAALLNSFLNHPKFKNYEIKTINSYQMNAKPCIDCGFCKSKEGCIYTDLDDVDEALQTCDLLIIASPIYNASFPAPLKAVFDRFQRYFNAKYSLKIISSAIKNPKKAVTLLTQGTDNTSYEEVMKKQLLPMFQLLNVINLGQIICIGTDNKKFDIDNFLIKSDNKTNNIINKI